MFDLDALLKVAIPPADLDKAWLEGATDAVDYVVGNSQSEDIILYTGAGQAWIYAMLAPLANVTPPDLEDLQRSHAGPDGGWVIDHVWGGGEPERVYISAPLDSSSCKSLRGGEQLVFRRYFNGVDKGPVRTELSQKLVQALDLYWLDEESAFCKLNEDGDIEPIIRVINLSRYTGKVSDIVVTINAHELHRYMAVTEMALVTRFDFTRYRPKAFGGWHQPTRGQHIGEHLYHHSGVQSECSFVNGVLVSRPLLTQEMLVRKSRHDWNDEGKEYATFKAHDAKNNRLAEVSCAPTALASYFEKDSPLPYQVTPAFFRPEVLQKYKADPEKYTLQHRSIECRASWYLKSYDVNEAGQVHAYLCDLAMLPYKEQLYWQSFNEWPKGPISKRAFETDILGKFTSIEDPVMDLKYEIEKIDGLKPEWWLVRGQRLASTLHYPITTSIEEWANAILALDQLVVEGFSPKSLRKRLKDANRSFDKQWGSVRLLQECLICVGIDEDDAIDIVEPLKALHHLRSKVKGHSSESERQQLIRAARTEHGRLSAHFRSLVADVRSAFDRIVEAL
ncbi:hypothetical protein LZ496_09930 [Sphingomonas sp. NSE70-1]|uniref:Uncharacterized protein n=1 Tax=Sphingomonas caseinilyticus TaxID=2908205 RepID=A0ABT0RW09_9SPHN|nr:hypothetical protein [Sphingomonas caseinilyticus]MCL6699096.1 hypothetical protein [Sphingomonas caseinilyticus]